MSKSKSTSFLAQVRSIQANVDRDGNVTDRALMLVVLETKAPSVVGQPGPFYSPYAEAHLRGAQGFPLALSPADSNSIKAGDWLSVKVTQLTEEEQDQLAKALVERSDALAKIEELQRSEGLGGVNADMLKRLVEVAEKQLKRNFGQDD